MKLITAEEVDRSVDDLYDACSKNKGIYSVIETVESMGMDYTQIKLWAVGSEH